MIPKTIHYCWFGKAEKPKPVQKCIASWKRHCPDYEIVEWNEDNFDVYMTDYTRDCYENQKWAFLSDFARLYIVNAHGGIYLDTDVEVVRSPDPLLTHTAFFGFETDEYVCTGLGFGAEKNTAVLQAMMAEYERLQPDESGHYPLINCPRLNTKALDAIGLIRNGETQDLDGVAVYSTEYFNPYDDPTGRLNKTPNTYSIHWYSKSWMSKTKVLRSKLTKPLHRLLGADFFRRK